MTPAEFRRLGHLLVDWIADYRERVGELPVMSRVEPGAVRDALPAAPPDEPQPFADILRDVDEILVPGLSHWQSPRFFGYFPSNGALASVLGDFLSTGLGVLGLSWQSSPALSELEEVVCDWVRQMVGLSPAWSGVIQDTASTSTLVALICARERAGGYALAGDGMQGRDAPLVVYASAHSHSSVEKAALLAGFGRNHVRRIASTRATRCAPTPSRRPSPRTSRAGSGPAPWWPRPAPPPPPRSTRWAPSPRARARRACGSTSTRRWRDRR